MTVKCRSSMVNMTNTLKPVCMLPATKPSVFKLRGTNTDVNVEDQTVVGKRRTVKTMPCKVDISYSASQEGTASSLIARPESITYTVNIDGILRNKY